MATSQKIELIPYEELHYDLENPRLPLELHGKNESELAQHYSKEAEIYELAVSMLENGFFAHEPLIVIKNGDKGYVVVEGNRRLTAIRLLLEHVTTEGLNSPALPLHAEHITHITAINLR